MKNKYWYIKERHNPQFDKPYYVDLGNISVKEAKAYEQPLYGDNIIHKFFDYLEYQKALKLYGLEERK